MILLILTERLVHLAAAMDVLIFLRWVSFRDMRGIDSVKLIRILPF